MIKVGFNFFLNVCDFSVLKGKPFRTVRLTIEAWFKLNINFDCNYLEL